MEQLTQKELVQLVNSVFSHLPEDRNLAILMDIPRHPSEDSLEWESRRKLAAEWSKYLQASLGDINLEKVDLLVYPNVGSNNANLPEVAYAIKDAVPITAEDIGVLNPILFSKLFTSNQIFIAITEFSATAPLKLAAPKYGFRAATMPGFSHRMIPALRLDYNQIHQRVLAIKNKLDLAEGADVIFEIDNKQQFAMYFDLRFRSGHASSGRFGEPGVAGNLPGGEAYIVPYEGERAETSKTEGVLPVQFNGDLLLYKIEKNKATKVKGEGEFRRAEAQKIVNEPAYANIAELGFGVLADFGIEPTGEILLDEKLGFHVAFGRSDHFGGSVGPSKFTSPQTVVHIDRVYLPTTQPRVMVKSVTLNFKEGHSEKLMENGKYVIFA